MGKSKRKSDGDLLAVQRKARKARSPSLSSASEKEEHDKHQQSSEEDELFVSDKRKTAAKRARKTAASDSASSASKKQKKEKKRSRKSEPIKRITRFDADEAEGEEIEEDEEEGGPSDTQDFLGFVEMQQKKKIQDAKLTSEFMTNFTSTVEEDEEAMLKQLDTLEEESTNRSSTFLKTFKSVFEASRPKPLLSRTSTSANSGPDLPSFLSLQEKSMYLISNANAILNHLAEADKLTETIQLSDLLDVHAFHDASLVAEKALKGGRRVGRQQTQALLEGVSLETIQERERMQEAGSRVTEVGESDDRDSTHRDMSDDDEQKKLELDFFGGRSSDLENGKGWGFHARKLEKLGKKIIKMGSGGLIVEH